MQVSNGKVNHDRLRLSPNPAHENADAKIKSFGMKQVFIWPEIKGLSISGICVSQFYSEVLLRVLHEIIAIVTRNAEISINASIR